MARTEGQWNKKGTFLIPVDDIPIVLKNDYLNFGGLIPGDIGFGIRNNSGTMQFKNSGGEWVDIGPTVKTPTGIVDPIAGNTTFTPTKEPKWVIADGATYFDGEGYTWTGTDIEMDLAPSNFIRFIV